MDFSKFIQNRGLYDYNLKAVVFYLISLFYKTDCKFEYSKRTINRLLTIYKLCCNKNGYDCFEDTFYIGKPYSTYRELDFLERDIYLRSNSEENYKIKLNKEKLNSLKPNKQITNNVYLGLMDLINKTQNFPLELLNKIFILQLRPYYCVTDILVFGSH